MEWLPKTKIERKNIDTDSFIVYIKTDDIYIGIANHVKTRFCTLNYEIDRLLPKEKDIKVTGFRKIN